MELFPQNGEKVNIIPVRKKNDEQLLKKYCPISLPPICAKVIERLIYNKMFDDEREARSAFLEKKWHNELIFKSKQNGIQVNLLVF